MPARRAYTDGCSGSHALNLIGDRWALPIVRELMLAPKRFTKLRRDLPGLSANILTQRLEEMAAAGIVVQQELPPPADISVYALTPWGRDLWPAISELVRWGIRSPDFPGFAVMSATSFILSMRAFFDPQRAEGLSICLGLDIDGDSFTVEINDAALLARADRPETADAYVSGGTGLMKRLFYMREDLASLQQDGLIIAGDATVIARLANTLPVREIRAA